MAQSVHDFIDDWNNPKDGPKLAASMADYFTRALDAAYERAESDEKEKAAMRSAMNDKICQTITLRSNFTYTSNRGQESKISLMLRLGTCQAFSLML